MQKTKTNKLINMISKILYLIFAIVIFSSCGSGGGNNTLEVPDSVKFAGTPEVSDETMKGIVENVSSPVEMAALIKSMGVPYSKKYLATTSYLSKYNTSMQQALALGIFGADLGYLNMYGKTGSVVDYLSTIKTLADNLNIGQFFDFTTLKRLASNNTNMDSMMYISVHSFNQMDNYLRENKRGSLSALIIAGVWLEGMYLATQVAKEKSNAKLDERIGGQKEILSYLMIILDNYSRDADFKKYRDEFKIISDKFSGIKITYEVGEPESVIENGVLTVKQMDKSIVSSTPEQLQQIRTTIEEVRTRLINI